MVVTRRATHHGVAHRNGKRLQRTISVALALIDSNAKLATRRHRAITTLKGSVLFLADTHAGFITDTTGRIGADHSHVPTGLLECPLGIEVACAIATRCLA